MERYGLTEPEAFHRVQSQSMNTAKPMKALAEAIILSARVLEDGKKRRSTAYAAGAARRLKPRPRKRVARISVGIGSLVVGSRRHVTE